MHPEEVRYRLLKLIEQRPSLTQREVAAELAVSVGKINYCLQALIQKGHVKLGNFRRNANKRQYSYLLTPSGLEAKTQLTLSFLRRKMHEYDSLKQEIEELKVEMASTNVQRQRKAAQRKKAG